MAGGRSHRGRSAAITCALSRAAIRYEGYHDHVLQDDLQWRLRKDPEAVVDPAMAANPSTTPTCATVRVMAHEAPQGQPDHKHSSCLEGQCARGRLIAAAAQVRLRISLPGARNASVGV